MMPDGDAVGDRTHGGIDALSESSADALRREILDRVREFYQAGSADKPPFEPGRSRVSYAGRVFDEAELVNLVDSSLDFWLTYGRFSERFEKDFASYLGVSTALLVNSGSSANLLAFMALTSERLGDRAIRRGDEVITVAAAFPTTVAPIVQFGAVPVFVDVVLETGNVDVTLLDGALSSRTKAVMLAHTLGNPFDVRAVKEFSDRHGLWLIEDNCDSLGSTYEGRLTGTFGDIGTSSFYPPHHMTMGEGGAVYTSDETLSRILLSMRDWGRDCHCPSGRDNACGKRFEHQFGTLPFGYDHKYVYSEFGYNLKVSDMQAAVGCAQLEKLPSFTEARKRNWAHLRDALADLGDRFVLPDPTTGSDPSWFGFLLTVRPESGLTRDAIVRELEAAKIQTRAVFAGNLTRHPCFDTMRATGEGYRVAGELTNTDRIMTDAFWVGVYPGMTAETLDYVAARIRAAAE
jgi:CDP-6-deoxy-D-xylo-4-hexulose-3-dehydrase